MNGKPLNQTLHDLRKMKGFTQTEVAKDMGISQWVYAKAEQGVKPITFGFKSSFCTAIGITVYFFEAYRLEEWRYKK